MSIPLGLAVLIGQIVIKKKGIAWFENKIIRKTQWIILIGLDREKKQKNRKGKNKN